MLEDDDYFSNEGINSDESDDVLVELASLSKEDRDKVLKEIMEDEDIVDDDFDNDDWD